MLKVSIFRATSVSLVTLKPDIMTQVKKGKDVFIADTATVLGRVELGDRASVWFGAVIRGDSDQIKIGKETNIQDTAVVHVDPGVPVHIANGVTVGHGAIVHGASVDSNSLIGMRATLLNNVRVGKNCIVGAHALVTEGKIIPDNSLVLGAPAKIVRSLTDEEVESIRNNVRSYVKKGKEFLEGKYD